MYIRGLIQRNSTELAEAVPIDMYKIMGPDEQKNVGSILQLSYPSVYILSISLTLCMLGNFPCFCCLIIKIKILSVKQKFECKVIIISLHINLNI